MDGIKCPVCNAISLLPGVKDGEFIKCSYCNSKYTVTPVRRYSLLARGAERYRNEQKNRQILEGFVHNLDYDNLLLLSKITINELFRRYSRIEYNNEELK